jgi:hypothetical protein
VFKNSKLQNYTVSLLLEKCRHQVYESMLLERLQILHSVQGGLHLGMDEGTHEVMRDEVFVSFHILNMQSGSKG